MEYGSEFDLASNLPFKGEFAVPEGWRLYRSGRDALKAFARAAGRKRVLLPALCCESMAVPFRINGYETVFYRLQEDYRADEQDLKEKLCPGDILLYMHYFGIPAFRDSFLTALRDAGQDLLFLEDRTHDILVSRPRGAFHPDATAASLRKWAALPEGGMLESGLICPPAEPDPAYGELRLKAMREKSRYLESGEEELRKAYMEKLRRAEKLLDESPKPAGMHEKFRKILEGLDLPKILDVRRQNIRHLLERLAPLTEDGSVRLMTDSPEKSGLYLPVLVQDRDRVHRELIARKIYCPGAIWPEPEGAAGVCPVSRKTTLSMLALLCDQRCTREDMDYMADALIEIIRGRGENTSCI